MITEDSAPLSSVPFVSSYICGPAEFFCGALNRNQFTYGPLGLCSIMKHKRKKEKTSKRKRKKEVKRELERVARTNAKLKLYAMASGFQGSSHTKSDDDDILVVYDKLRESNTAHPRKKLNDQELCVVTPNYGNPCDIPLPSEHLLRMEINARFKLEDIPLPPSPNPIDRLHETDILSKMEIEAKQIKNLLKEFRKWEHTDLGKTLLSQGDRPSTEFQEDNSFTVMSYNVLAQDLLLEHRSLYQWHDARALKWDYRSRILLQEIKEANADILCFQEVQASHLDSFYSKLKNLGYKGIFKRRSEKNVDGCAVYYKSDKFHLIESTTVEYFQDYQDKFCVLDRHNVAIIVKLALKKYTGTENHVVVATTHLLYNPRRHDVKLAQSQVLLAEIDRVSFIGLDAVNGKPKYLPTIVTGDFNLQPEAAVYNFLTEGFLCYAELAARSLTSPSYGLPRQESLLPDQLQISSYCQHLGVMLHRLKQTNNPSLDKCPHVSKVTKLYNSELYKTPLHYIKKQKNIPLLYEEDFYGRSERGCLRHLLRLQSVYKHKCQSSLTGRMVPEATTHQDDWVTVDYIFYSGNWNQQKECVEEGRLKLLSRYTLPSVGQCHELKSIPNLGCGSDHLSLMARFLLSTE